MKLILASASPRRRQLLKQLKIPFRILPSDVSEKSSERDPIRLVQQLALRKANHVARKLAKGQMRGSSGFYVLGADTVVVLHGKILGKPRDCEHAYRMLLSLSGSTHYVYTGVALVNAKTQKSLVAHAKSSVRMKKISEDQLRRLSKKHLDKAGSYAIQEKHDPIARVVKGSYDNVVGLPVGLVRKLLRAFRV